METQYQARRLASHPSLFMWSGSNELSPSSKGWPILFLETFFPNLTKIDSSRPVWPACPAYPWASGVDNNGLPNGEPFVPSVNGSPHAPGEVHAYWFSLCSTLENCAAGVKGLQPVDDAFYRSIVLQICLRSWVFVFQGSVKSTYRSAGLDNPRIGVLRTDQSSAWI